ncbi:MAG: cytochrome c3 family protein [bacterium]
MMIVKIARKIISMKRIGFLSLSVATVFFSLNFSGCSSRHSHKTLAFFFDGVPPAQGEKTAISGNDSIHKTDSAGLKGTLAKVDNNKIFYHQPYKLRECSSCHDQSAMGKFLKPQPMLCYQCHEDFSRKYKVLHGPVASGYCTACHEAHTGNYPKLIKRAGQQLCLYCHNTDQVFKNEAHKDIEDTTCTKCHNPHGSTDRKMLK